MLKTLRKKENAKKVFWLLAIIIVPFMLWGTGSIVRGRDKERYAGKIFSRKVSFEEFNDNFLAVKTQAIMQFGDNFHKIQKFLNLEQETWDRLILLCEVKKRQIKISDKEVIEAIKKYPFFQREGKFDPKIYADILAYSLQIPARVFEEQTRQSLMFAKLLEEITKTITVSDADLLKEYAKANEKVKISYILFPAQKFEKDIVINPAVIKDYYDKHKDEFKKPPSINIQYLGVELPAQPSLQEKEAIVNKINFAYEELKKNADFDKAAKDFGLSVKETGLFSRQGPVPAIGWSKEFLETAFNLKAQEISAPLETSKGIYILKLKEQKDSFIPGLAEMEPDIKKILDFKEAYGLAENKAKEASEKIRTILKAAQKIDFAKLAKSFTVEAQITPFFKYGDYIPNIGVAKEFQEAAFKLKDSPDKVSGVISLPREFCILKLEEYAGIDEKKFAQEKEEFKKSQLEKQKKEYFNKFFDELRKQAGLQNYISKN